MKKTFQITLDLVKSSEVPKISIKESDLDSIKFIFKILNNGAVADLTGATVQLGIKKPSLLTSYENCTITDAIAGTCEVILSNQSYLEIGSHIGELYITQNEEVTVTNSFEYASLDAIMSDNTLQSENNWQALHEILIANGQRPVVGEGNPNGLVTSEFEGQFYLDTLNDLMYFAPNEALTVWSPLVGSGGGEIAPIDWDSILDKPPTFTPSTHSHPIAEVTGLQASLDSKQLKPESVTAIPTKVPAFLGEMSVDGTNGRTYIAEGVTSDKWKRLATTTYVDVADGFIMNTILSGLSLWKGTQANYDAIGTKSPTTLYFITG